MPWWTSPSSKPRQPSLVAPGQETADDPTVSAPRVFADARLEEFIGGEEGVRGQLEDGDRHGRHGEHRRGENFSQLSGGCPARHLLADNILYRLVKGQGAGQSKTMCILPSLSASRLPNGSCRAPMRVSVISPVIPEWEQSCRCAIRSWPGCANGGRYVVLLIN